MAAPPPPTANSPTAPATDAREGLSPVWAWCLLAVCLLVAAAVAAGLAGTDVTAAVIALCTVAIAVGIRRNRPTLSWPMWGFVGAGLFWIAAGTAREVIPAAETLGGRSLWSDAIALPGYAVYGICLVALVRARDGRNRGAVTDALVVSIAGFLVGWQFVVARTLDIDGVSTPDRVSVVLYLMIDCAFVAFACRLAFATSQRLAVQWLILAAMCGLLVSDVMAMVDALGLVAIGERQEIGYLCAAAAMGAAGLHPSVRMLHLRSASRRRALPLSRAALLALSLMLPAAQQVLDRDHDVLSAWPYQIGVFFLATVATVRLIDSVRDQNAAGDALAWQAAHDSLTRLPNRNGVAAHIEEGLERQQGIDVVAYFDLDRFKNVNDAFGHGFGDQLLIAVGERLRERLPEPVLLGRIGGDEFVAIAPLDVMDPLELAAHVQSALAHPFVIDGSAVTTSASIGITTTNRCIDAHTILRDADTAMYRAKAAGGDTFRVFSDDMRVQVERRMGVERMLRDALDHGRELTTWFQPVVDLRTGEIEGFEALARWFRPDGPIPPVEFIPIAEDAGLVSRVGALVLDQACAGVAEARRRSGRPLFVSVNVSVRQLADDAIVDTVAETLDRHGLPGSALCLEITESIMVNDQNIERLHALRRLGVWLAVDDFGTGYSSLSYLRRMPVSKVKIDKSFVDDIERGDESILVAILSMASSLGLGCIAEGVEHEVQAQRLRSLGCAGAQGYLWAAPGPIDRAVDACTPAISAR